MYEEGNKRLSLNWGSLLIKLVIIAILVILACWVFIRITKNNNGSSTLATTDTEYINNVSAMKTAAFEYYTAKNLPEKVGETEKLTLAQMINQKLLIDFTNNGKTCDTNSSYVQTTKTSDGNYALKVSLNCGKKEDFIVTTIENKELNCPEVTKCNIKETEEVKNNSTATNTSSNATKTSTNNTSTNIASNNTSATNTTKASTSNNTAAANNTTTTKTTTTTTTTTIKVNISCITCTTDTKNDDKTVWPGVMYVVKFDLNGGKGSIDNQEVTAGKTVSKPADPTRVGYTFVEWQLDGKTYDFSAPVTGNITLKAIWKENTKTRYYEYVKYGDWVDGYLTGNNIENRYNDVTSYNYCKETTKTYYTSSYVTDWTDKNSSYSYEYQMLDLDPTKIAEGTIGVVASSKSYFNNNNLADYNNYLAAKNAGVMYMTGNTGKGDSSLTNAGQLKTSSLTSKNFTFNISGAYLQGGTYRTTITINYKNNNGVTPYYDSKLGYNVYAVPVKFDVSFAYNSDCIRDYAGNEKYYSNRGYTSISNPQITQRWQHRTITTTWSSDSNLSGWTKTGNTEYR